MNSPTKSTVEPDLVSKIKYLVYLENNLQILNDMKTIIGVKYEKNNKNSHLVIEAMGNNQNTLMIFGEHKNEIASILIVEDLNCFFVGGWDEKIVQYSLNGVHGSGKVIMEYKDLKICPIFSLLRIGNFAIIGGSVGQLKIIEINKKRANDKIVRVSPQRIFSLSFCKITSLNSENKMLLVANGDQYNYSSELSDVLDITNLFLDISNKNLQN